MKQSWSLKKFFPIIGKLSLIAILWLGGVYAFDIINKTHLFNHAVTTEVSADGNINVWWPTQGSHVSDTQTFKAQVTDKKIEEYSMSWSVDGGQQNQMNDSSTDYPHKEAVVDLAGWKWKGTGPYKVTFTAVDKSNAQIGQATVEIYTPEPAQSPTTIEAATSTAPTATTTPGVTLLGAANVVSAIAGIPTASAQAPAPVQTITSSKVSIWWPLANAKIQDLQQFKAKLEDTFVENYRMYWQVDGGQLNEMNNVGDHKEVSVDLSGWMWRTDGSYKLTFVAKDMTGKVLGTADQTITVTHGDGASQTQIQTQTAVTTPAVQESLKAADTTVVTRAITPTAPNQSSGNNVFAGQKLYVNPSSDPKRTADQWRSSRPQDAYQLDKIASGAETVWLGGWNSDISGFVKNKVQEIKNQGALPVFVAYNIPNRDCGQYSAGGVSGANEYKSWIQKIADSIGDNKAAVIIEPDALTLTNCLGSGVDARYSLIKDAVAILKSKAHIGVYIDAGHPEWIGADDMANRLQKSGIAQADGFALNISNFFTTQDNINYGSQISSKVGGKHFVIDTGRNGVGPTADRQWCNPKGMALGARPTTSTGNSLVDAFLWVKGPGGSDGNCNGGPNAGDWWPDYALEIAKRSAN